MDKVFSGAKLCKWDGSKGSDASVDALKGKIVAVYFSAHWCPPCRQFTPILRDFYNELEGENFEVVFVSFDRSNDDLQSYMKEAHGNWIFVPFGDDGIEKLTKEFKVSGIPQLIILKPDGSILSDKARGDVSGGGKAPKDTLAKWKQEAGL